MASWQCVKQCGACCNLHPPDRPGLETYLTPDQLAHYHSLVGEDGWCIHYDKTARECRIYADRPSFCRVEAETFKAMFDVAAEDLNDFAIDCCYEQIAGVYGTSSPELERFEQGVGLV